MKVYRWMPSDSNSLHHTLGVMCAAKNSLKRDNRDFCLYTHTLFLLFYIFLDIYIQGLGQKPPDK